MNPDLGHLSAQASVLASRFVDIGAKLADAARALQDAGAPPADALVEELALAREEFLDLRGIVVASAEEAGLAPSVALESIQSLEPVITAVAQALDARRHRAAIEQARAAVLGILDRAATLVHRDDPGFAPLQSCYTKAAALRAAVEVASDAAQAQALSEGVRAFAELLTLVEEPRTLSDEVYAELEESVARVFGPALAVAAARGRLTTPDALEAERGRAASPLDITQPSAAATPPPAPIIEPSPAPSLEPPPAPIVEHRPAPTPEPPPSAFAPPTLREAPAAEPTTARTAADDDSAQWWLAAWARWSGWRNNLSFPDAVREELGKYPYLLSVPIQESPSYEEGLVAYGYSILLDHVERQAPGSIGNALTSLRAGGGQSVGAQLYEYLVTQGRLPHTYGDFVRDVLAAALPEPAMWFDARLVDGRDNTRLFTRSTRRIGDSEHTPTRLNSDGQRFTTHHFTVTLPPLTTRFFVVTVEPQEYRTADVRVTRNGAPCDSAWLATVPSGPKARVTPARVAAEGTTVGALGRDAKTLWIAIFNADPAAAYEYALALGFRKDARARFGSKGKPGAP